MDGERKPWTMIFVCKDGRIVKVEHVFQSQTMEGTVTACTGHETYIFPLANLIYAELLEEKEDDVKDQIQYADQDTLMPAT